MHHATSVLLLSLVSSPVAREVPLSPFDGEAVDLAVSWRLPVGSSYARVAGGEGLVVTQGGDGESDLVVAIDAASGAERWRAVVGPVHRGHDGSEDGPISTPVVANGRVHALGPRGEFLALDAATGNTLWSRDLVEDLGAKQPDYGFASSPLVVGDVLVLQAGGKDGAHVVGFDPATGEERWRAGEGAASYRSAALLELAGRAQLVVSNGSQLQGIAPADGALLWTLTTDEPSQWDAEGSGSAGAIDDERFFFYDAGALAVYSIAAADDGYVVEEVYESRELGGTYAQPVYFDGHFYGFRSAFLTCVDAETGKRVWKSRPPGGRGLTLVDDRLVVYGADGAVVVASASPEGYVEESRITALERSGHAYPTAVSGQLFVRNGEEVACLRMVEASPVVARADEGASDASAPPVTGVLRELAQTIAGADDATAVVDAFLSEHESLPIVEGSTVHFVYRGEARDVAITGGMTGGGPGEPLHRFEGTNLFGRSYEIEPGARWEYLLQVDFGERAPDPANPHLAPGRRGPVSDVVTEGYVRCTHVEEPPADRPRGRVEEVPFESRQLDNSRTLSVYLPPGYERGVDAFPLILVHDGPSWLEQGALPNTLDNLIGESVAPVVVVFIEPQQAWWFEAGGSRTEEYVDMLATELVPMLSERYRLLDGPEHRAITGIRGNGVTASLAVVKHPDVFGRAVVQSVALDDVARHALFAGIEANPPLAARFYVDWNRYEERDNDSDTDFARDGRTLTEALRRVGCDVIGGEALDCHGWTSFRSRTDRWLEAFFPADGE